MDNADLATPPSWRYCSAVITGSAGRFSSPTSRAWAISTSNDPREGRPDEAGDRHGFLRSVIATELAAERAADTRLLYGGSVTDNNADAYFTLSLIHISEPTRPY